MSSNVVTVASQEKIAETTNAAVTLHAASAVMYLVSDALLYVQLWIGCEVVTSDYSCTTLCEKRSNHLLAAVLKSACKIVKPSAPQTEKCLFSRVSQPVKNNNSGICLTNTSFWGSFQSAKAAHYCSAFCFHQS